MALAVNERSAAAAKMGRDWPMIEALMGGSGAMREKGEALLPKFAMESQPTYDGRLKKATLFPAYRRTVTVMAGKPFSKPLTLSEDTPAEIAEEWSKNIDRQGVNLNTFAAEMFSEALAYGFGGILVDMPTRAADAPPISKAEADKTGFRPYFIRVRHNDVLGWRGEVVDGAHKLTQLRLLECTTEPDGEFGEKEVERVRVLTPGAWALYEKQSDDAAGLANKWVLVGEGVTSLNVIPFVPVYGRRLGFMQGAAPLVDLAYQNVKHWQSQSDQDNILHIARVPILVAIGIDENQDIVVGASTFTKLPREADLKFVEHTGAAIEAGAASIAQLEEQMIQSGAELLVKKPGDRSATEAANDAEANKSDLQRIAEDFEASLDQALQLMADFAGLEVGGSAQLFKDYGASNLTEASGQLVIAMRTARMISSATAINEMKRRGELAAEVDPEAEELAVAEEVQALEPEEDEPPVAA